ncbi:MAG: hypothetical protein LBW85_14630 [Deltaproteobacteria bacterium]|jgi:hypothetical protein|nr:hypothetical protein [Deltaproteobacteria bacterium]
MRKHAFILSAALAGGLLLAAPAALQAQEPPQPGQGGVVDADYDRQQQAQPPAPAPRQADPDGLLTDLFSDPGSAPPGGQPPAALPPAAQPPAGQPLPGQAAAPPPPAPPAASGGGPGLSSLPGVPSPVTTPARPGEAVIERTAQPCPPGCSPQPAAAAPVRRRGGGRAVKPYTAASPWVQDIHRRSAKAWIPRTQDIPCSSLVGDRPLYHIRCVNKPPIGRYRGDYKENPAVYHIWP